MLSARAPRRHLYLFAMLISSGYHTTSAFFTDSPPSRPAPTPSRYVDDNVHTHTHLYTYTCARSAGQRVSVRSGYITTKRARTIKYVIYSRRSSSRAPDAYYELPAKPVPSSGFARPEPLVPAVGSAHPGNHGVDGL